LPLFGGQAAGLTVSTANSGYLPHELAHQIRNSEAKLIITSSDLLPITLKALQEKDVNVKADRVFVMPGMDGKVAIDGGAKSWEELKGKKGFKPIKKTDKKGVTTFPACESPPRIPALCGCHYPAAGMGLDDTLWASRFLRLLSRRPTILEWNDRSVQRCRHFAHQHYCPSGSCAYDGR
jgi:hypothetical protein